MKRYNITILAILGLLMTSCKKDIEIDYHQVDPLYVVEATVSEDGMQARISLTNNMDNNSSKSDISEALVVITGSDGSSQTLSHKGNGIYKSSATGTPDVEYTITIDVDGRHFTSTSTMQKAPKVNDFYFIRKKIVSENFQMAKLCGLAFGYCRRCLLSTGYRWAVKKDDTDPNKEQQQLFTFAREGSDDKDLLREGDRIRLELRSIDRKSYDYLYSMQIMDNTGTNPIPNFTGGCLGYFSAYSHVVYNYVFHEADMKDED